MTRRFCRQVLLIVTVSSRAIPAARLGGLSTLAGIVVSLMGALPAPGEEVPFTERVISTDAVRAWSVFATDLDGDGDIDVLSASEVDGKIAWYENDGSLPPTFSERLISTTSRTRAHSVFATDLDGDGDVDVLSALWHAGKIVWNENDGGSPPTFTERVISRVLRAEGAASVFATDVDGDGNVDVLSASFFLDKIAWYRSDGGSPPTFHERTISFNAVGAHSVFATDVDGDGDIDVLSASQFDDKIAWYENDGGSPPTFTERVISTAANGAASVFATDVDGDGNVDVLSASQFDDKIAWYESDGGSPPTFTERVISSNADGAFSVFAMDVDGDGDIDVLSVSQFDDKIAWYESDGGSPPTFTERVISTAAEAAASVFATDLDGDGDIDVLSASILDDKIAWYENRTPICGDGRIEPGEECDDRGESVTCDVDCTVAECGDGTLNVTAGEECDGEPNCTNCCLNDQDGDGVCDDVDDCPTDPDKIEPGICGCGVSDEDMDDDGKADCTDRCPNDPDKLDPGICGCGVVDEGDVDGDTVLDCVDRCPDEDDTIDVDRNGIRDCQQYQSVPTVSEWGIVSLILLLVAGLTIKFRDPVARILAR